MKRWSTFYRRRDYKRQRIASTTFESVSYPPVFSGCHTIVRRRLEEDDLDSQSDSDKSEFDDPAFWQDIFDDSNQEEKEYEEEDEEYEEDEKERRRDRTVSYSSQENEATRVDIHVTKNHTRPTEAGAFDNDNDEDKAAKALRIEDGSYDHEEAEAHRNARNKRKRGTEEATPRKSIALRRVLFRPPSPPCLPRRRGLSPSEQSHPRFDTIAGTDDGGLSPSKQSHPCFNTIAGTDDGGLSPSNDDVDDDDNYEDMVEEANNDDDPLVYDVCEHECNREEYAKKMRKDFRQSTPQELLAWKKNNTSSTTTHLSKAPQNVQDKWKKIKQICDDCPSKKLDVWVDGTYLLLLLLLLLTLFWFV